MDRKIILALVCFYLASNSFIQAADLQKTKENDYSVIWERNLFGLIQKNKESKSILMPVIAPLTQQIIVKGTILREDPSENLVVIEDLLTRKEDLYKVGEIIRDAQIISISQNKVAFSYHNNVESLSFLATVATPSSSIMVGGSSILRETPGEEITTPPKNLKLAEAIKNLKANSKLYSKVSIAPVINDERKVNGYMVANIPERSLVEMMGFRDNDVITHVNGILINSPQRAFEIYRSIAKKESAVRVKVLRNGRPNILSFQLQ